MSTPKQASTAPLETPFGPARIHDHRDHKTPRPTAEGGSWYDRTTVAVVQIEPLTVNGKTYPTGKSFEIVMRGDGSKWAMLRDAYRGMTPKGQEKVAEWLQSWDALAPYFEALDEASRHASHKHSIAYPIHRAISDAASNRYYPSDEGRAQDALIDEILADILAARAAGIHYSDIEV